MRMAELRRIKSIARVSLSDDFRRAEDPAPWRPFEPDNPVATEVVRSDIDLGRLQKMVDAVVAAHSAYDTAIDRALTVDLHRSLPISRREAGDQLMWAWLGVCFHPRFVAHRWKPNSTPTHPEALRSQDRFMGNRVRQAFARLWWA